MKPTKWCCAIMLGAVVSTLCWSQVEAKPLPHPIKPLLSLKRMATVTYTTGFDYADFAAIRTSIFDLDGSSIRPWGEHPIIWKAMIRPELVFDPYGSTGQGYVLFEGVPTLLSVQVGDSVLLNNYEASGAFSDANGSTVNPVGHWVETFSTDGEEVAILAAMAIWRWNTPVYLNYAHDPGTGQPISRVGVVDSVTLSTPAGVPHEVCGWSDPDASTTCPGLVIESVSMSYYSDALLGSATLTYFGSPDGTGSDQVPGAEFVSTYESLINAFHAGPVIYDPPGKIQITGAAPFLVELASRAQATGGVQLRNCDGSLSSSK